MPNNESFKVSISVYPKAWLSSHRPIWEKVHLDLRGDRSDFINLQKQLGIARRDIEKGLDKKGYALRDVNIRIEFLD